MSKYHGFDLQIGPRWFEDQLCRLWCYKCQKKIESSPKLISWEEDGEYVFAYVHWECEEPGWTYMTSYKS